VLAVCFALARVTGLWCVCVVFIATSIFQGWQWWCCCFCLEVFVCFVVNATGDVVSELTAGWSCCCCCRFHPSVSLSLSLSHTHVHTHKHTHTHAHTRTHTHTHTHTHAHTPPLLLSPFGSTACWPGQDSTASTITTACSGSRPSCPSALLLASPWIVRARGGGHWGWGVVVTHWRERGVVKLAGGADKLLRASQLHEVCC
jgi:hypothetical protein